jgi:hypothetical protein
MDVAGNVASAGLSPLVYTGAAPFGCPEFASATEGVQIQQTSLIRSAKPLCVGSIPTRASNDSEKSIFEMPMGKTS